MLSAWLTDSKYHTTAGFPLDLPFSGEEPNFTELVKDYSGDMYPRAIADELIRAGSIQDIGGALRIVQRAFVPGTDAAMMIDLLGLETSDLLETLDHNLQASTDNNLLQMRVRSINLPAKHL